MPSTTAQALSVAWQLRAADLTQWALDHLINRTDAWGVNKTDGSRATGKGRLDRKRLVDHFRGRKIIGVHLISLENTCKTIKIDIDAHGDGDTADVAARNMEIALDLDRRAHELGLNPILSDSNGKGGYHFEIVFAQPISAKDAYYFGLWLARDYNPNKERGIEVFPKRPDRDTEKGYGGGWVRLYGKHHKRDHWTKVWSAEGEWTEGSEAIAVLLAHTGDDPAKLTTIDYMPPPAPPPPPLAILPGGRPANALERARQYLSKIEPPDPREAHPMDATTQLLKGASVCNGFGLDQSEALQLLAEWDSGNPFGRSPDNEYRRKLSEALKKKPMGWILAQDQTSNGNSGKGRKGNAAAKPGTADDEAGTIKVLADAIELDNHFARDAGGRLYRYVKGVFKPGADKFVKAQVKRLCMEWGKTKKWSTRLSAEVVEFIGVDSPELRERPPTDLVNTENGMVQIEDGVMLPHDPEYLSMVQLPVKYNPAATCPAIESFVRTSFPLDAYDLAWEIPGVLMVPMTWLQKAILLLGCGGNGKSAYLSLIVRFLGKRNVATMPLHLLETDKFSVSRLVGKLANICADLPSEHLAGTSTFKALTGGDTLPAEYKFKDSFDLDPFARLVFSANHPPRSADSSSAFFRRWTVIPFDRSFDDTAEEIPRDILDARLQAPEELSGLLNKALDGLRRVQRQRRFTESESVKAAWRDFHATTDPLAVWLDRNTIDDPDAVVIKHVLRVAYNAAVERDGRPAMTAKAFGQAIYKLRPNIDEKQRTIGNKLQWCYVGIGLRTYMDDSHDSHDSRDSPLYL